jgi:hypothetical protein
MMSVKSANGTRTAWTAWTRRGLFGALVGSVLVAVAVHSGSGRGAGRPERGDLGTPAEQVLDCERAADLGREGLAARLRAARRQGSVERVLCVAEALAAMGDGAAVRDAVRVAERLAGLDAEARADVRVFRERFAEWAGAPSADVPGSVTASPVSPPGPDPLALMAPGPRVDCHGLPGREVGAPLGAPDHAPRGSLVSIMDGSRPASTSDRMATRSTPRSGRSR